MDQHVIQFTKTMNDESASVIMHIFDNERPLKPLVIPYIRNTNPTPVRKIEPMVIRVPTPFSFDGTKVMP